jgi:uncharacterized repeat protein (TIGR01451 family)
MAGKLSLAAKLFLASTVLATGGGGAYVATTTGWPALLRYATDRNAMSRAEANQEAAAFESGDLDAVASAWAEPAPTSSSIPADSSPTARTADVVLATAETPLPPGDRYAPANSSTQSDVVDPLENAPDAVEQAPAIAAQPLPAMASSQETAVSVDEKLTADAPAVATDLARGQEPKEGPAFAEDGEPQPLPLPGNKLTLGAQQQQPVSSRRRQTAEAGDRYGATPSAEPAIVNPFSSKQPTNGATADAPQSIEPLSDAPDEIGGPLTELQQGDENEPSSDGDRPIRSARSNLSGQFRASPSRDGSNALEEEPNEAPSALGGLSPDMPTEGDGADGTGRPGERALEGAQRPALEIQKFAPGEIQVGKPAKFVIQIRNVGTQAADEVIIHDEVPQGTRLISTSPTAESNASQLVWHLGKLSAGEDRTVEMQLMPTAEGEIGSVATVSYSAQASVKTRCTMPQLAIRMTAPSKVMIGQEQRVKIELRNPGSGDATGVMLFENVPQNVRHASGPALEFEIGTLKAGETRELELVLLAEKAGKTVNVLSARADGNLQVQQQVEFDVIAPELVVDVHGPERRYLERPATYQVSVENPGTATAHDVQIVTKLPKGLRFVRANNMGEYDAATHAVYWSLAELPEGERGTVELVAMPVETGTQTLEVESRTGEGLADQVKQEIIVDGLAAIMFELRDLEDPIEVGGETGYEIRVANQGTKAATNVQVVVDLPNGIQFVSAEGETQHTAQGGRIAFDPIAELAPKADTVYRVRVQGTQPGDQRITVEVNTDDVAQPIRREESTRVFGDE